MEEDDPERRVGALVASKYELKRLLGAGGMGAVYEAEHSFTNRRVAVKLMHESFARAPVLGERFVREAQAPTAIGHPGIVEVLDGGYGDDGEIYLVLELLKGETLAENDGAMSLPQLVDVTRQLLSALEAAHSAGFIHRDIKPDNIFLAETPEGARRVKLLDFGVAGIREGAVDEAQLTRTGTILGTPMFMSPEQASGERVGHRSDLWAVGAILYDALAGHPPYQGDTYNQLIVSIATREHVPLSRLRPDLPRALLEVIARALRKRPQERFESAKAMADALGDIPDLEAHSGVIVRPAELETPSSKRATAARRRQAPRAEPTTAPMDSAELDAAAMAIAQTRPSEVEGVPALRASAGDFDTRTAAPARSSTTVTPMAVSTSRGQAGSGGRLLVVAAAVLALTIAGLLLLTWSRRDPGDATLATAPAAAPTDDGAARTGEMGAPPPTDEEAEPAAGAADIAAPQADADTAGSNAADSVGGVDDEGTTGGANDGPLGPGDLSAALSPVQPTLQRCYQDSLATLISRGKDPASVTRLDVGLTVSAQGKVLDVGLRGDAPAALVSCMRGELLGLQFRPSASQSELSFPVIFQPNVLGQ